MQNVQRKNPDEFTQDLETAGKALADASRDVRVKSLASEKVTADLDDARKREIKYREDVLAELRKLQLQLQVKPPQPVKATARVHPPYAPEQHGMIDGSSGASKRSVSGNMLSKHSRMPGGSSGRLDALVQPGAAARGPRLPEPRPIPDAPINPGGLISRSTIRKWN